MKKKLLLISIITLIISAFCYAGEVSEQQARNIASNFINSKSNSTLKSAKALPQSLLLTYTKELNGSKMLYVFNRGDNDGFVIVSGDDNAMPVLGYSDTGTFDEKNVPDNLQWWLNEYASEIEYAANNPAAGIELKDDSNKSVAPLLGNIKWDQSEPYNNLCPMYNGKRSVTGCVATAMAQAMYYNKYPAKGTGSNSYSWNNTTLSCDFANTTFDWNVMTPTYDSNSSETAKNAVATLMYACGVGVNMQYSAASSAASSSYIPSALYKYFGYSAGLKYLKRQYYDYGSWIALIKNELDNNRVVLYGGDNGSAGHAFVCDGYAPDNYFHYNWGWSGVSNGYFLVTALNPGSQGIGGNASGFNQNQDIITGLKAEDGTETSLNILTCSTGLIPAKEKFARSEVFEIKDGVTLSSTSPVESYQNLYMLFINEDKNESQIVKFVTNYKFDSTFSYKLGKMQLNLSPLENGKYKIYLISTVSGTSDIKKLLVPLGKDYLRIELTDDYIITSFPNMAKLNVVKWDIEGGKLYSNTDTNLKATVSCSDGTEYLGVVKLVLISNNQDVWASQSQPVDCMGEYPVTLVFNDNIKVNAGNYTLALKDKDGEILSSMPVTVYAQPTAGKLELVKGCNIINNAKDNVVVTATVKNSGSDTYVNYLELYLFSQDNPNSTYIYLRDKDSKYLNLAPGESKELTFNVQYPDGADNISCYAYLREKDKSDDLDQKQFNLGLVSGIENVNNAGFAIMPNPATDVINVSGDVPVTKIEVYSMAGEKLAQSNQSTIDVSSLSAGIYIIRIYTDSKTISKQFIKK